MEDRRRADGALRVALLILFLLLQLAALGGVLVFFQRKFAWFYAACELLSLAAALYILQQDANPSHKIPWILLLVLLPLFGGAAWLLFGRVYPTPRQRRWEQQLSEQLDRAAAGRPVPDVPVPPELERQTRYLHTAAGAPVYDGTQAVYLPSGEAYFDALLDALARAERFIFLEYYIVRPGVLWDRVSAVLREKAKQGVDVRLLYDAVGCVGSLPSDFAQRLARDGIACCAFNPPALALSARFNNRDHRKICVIDGDVGFTGGINLADEYANLTVRFGHWKDTGVLLRGAAVWNLTAAFLSLWAQTRGGAEDFRPFLPPAGSGAADAPGLVQPFVDTPHDNEAVGQTAYCNLLSAARRYVWIATPYLVPDYVLITALETAAKSGVDVRILTPGIPDKKAVYRLTRSYYPVLLRAGVRIYEYTPGFLHAKQFLSDDRCAIVGSINLDYRSLHHHHECAVWMSDVPALREMHSDFERMFADSREITLQLSRLQRRGYRLLTAVLRILAPLL